MVNCKLFLCKRVKRHEPFLQNETSVQVGWDKASQSACASRETNLYKNVGRKLHFVQSDSSVTPLFVFYFPNTPSYFQHRPFLLSSKNCFVPSSSETNPHPPPFSLTTRRRRGARIAQWYRMDDRGFRVPAGAGNFSLHHRYVQTGSGGHPASYPTGTRGSFPGAKAARAWSWPLTSI
jgi:hypothetical protein